MTLRNKENYILVTDKRQLAVELNHQVTHLNDVSGLHASEKLWPN
jgi:hypothetical protein